MGSTVGNTVGSTVGSTVGALMHALLNSVLDGYKRSASRPGHFNPRGRVPVHVVDVLEQRGVPYVCWDSIPQLASP